MPVFVVLFQIFECVGYFSYNTDFKYIERILKYIAIKSVQFILSSKNIRFNAKKSKIILNIVWNSLGIVKEQAILSEITEMNQSLIDNISAKYRKENSHYSDLQPPLSHY